MVKGWEKDKPKSTEKETETEYRNTNTDATDHHCLIYLFLSSYISKKMINIQYIKFLQVSPQENHTPGYQGAHLLNILSRVSCLLRISRYRSFLLRLIFVDLSLKRLHLFSHLRIDCRLIFCLTLRINWSW